MSEFNTEHLKLCVLQLMQESGETYVSLKLEVNAHVAHSIPVEVEWSCYSPSSGHTRRHASPAEAIADTRLACYDPGKLLAAAKALEDEAQRLRARLPKEGGAL